MRNLQLDARLSDMQMRQIARFVRNETNCSAIIEPLFESTLPIVNRTYADLYTTSTCPLNDKLPMIICIDTRRLLRRLSEHHGRTIRIVHHGVDNGKGFLKWDMTLEFEPEEKAVKIPDNSQKRVIMLCVIPEAAESNALFAEVYRLLNLPVDEYFHSFHADLKAIALATGIECGAASYPCCYCERKMTVDVPNEKQLTAGTMRSCKSNRRHCKQFKKSKDKTAKKYFSCNAAPIKSFPDDTLIITWSRLPELHLFLHVNYYIDNICRCHPPATAWYEHYHQTRSPFHGEAFQGPQLRRLTRKDSMEYLEKLL